MGTAALILAAGAGRRLGRPKALVQVGGLTLLERARDLARAAGCDPVVAVLRPGVAAPDGADAAVNHDPDAGMGGSLRVGLAHLLARTGPGTDRAVVLLVDMPTTQAAAVRLVAGALSADAPLATARYGAQRGHPVGFHRSRWAEVMASLDAAAASGSGDQGARGYLAAHPHLLTVVDCGDLPAPGDIDTPEDLERAQRGGLDS